MNLLSSALYYSYIEKAPIFPTRIYAFLKAKDDALLMLTFQNRSQYMTPLNSDAS